MGPFFKLTLNFMNLSSEFTFLVNPSKPRDFSLIDLNSTPPI